MTTNQGNLPGPVGGGSGPAGPLAWIRTRGSDPYIFKPDPQLDPDPRVHWRVGSSVGSGSVGPRQIGSSVGSGPVGPLAGRIPGWTRAGPGFGPASQTSARSRKPRAACLCRQASCTWDAGMSACLNLASGLLCAVAVNCSDVMAFLDRQTAIVWDRCSVLNIGGASQGLRHSMR